MKIDAHFDDAIPNSQLAFSAFVAGLRRPTARTTDPSTSHQAAAAVEHGENDMQSEIRAVVGACGAITAEGVANAVCRRNPDRWLHSSIVSACNPKRSGLVLAYEGKNARGRNVIFWKLP